MRFFNTEGPVVAQRHYCIPPLERFDLVEVLALIERMRYFVLHAPRQTGKTSALLALCDLLNSGAAGDYRCVYVNVEAAQAAREDVGRAMHVIVGRLASRARLSGDAFLYETWTDIVAKFNEGALVEALTRWSESAPRPLVLLIDEIDSLIGDTLISVLRQLRDGYVQRPESFPHSIVLCGVRDVRDYRIRSSAEQVTIAGGSAFNVKAGSLRMGDFTEAEVRALLAQHTAATGQPFTTDALATVWRQTQGQPWLVNALCQEACSRTAAGSDQARPVTEVAILEAQEQLILNRVTHLDQLTDKLQEERVRRVIEPLRLRRGGSATPAAGVPATDREQRRAHRARVRPGAGAHRSADHLAADRWRVAARGGQVRNRVQGAAREPGADGERGGAADRRLHGPVRGASGPLGHLRP